MNTPNTVTVRVHLKDLVTGEDAWHTYEIAPEHVESQEFWWTDGNMCCDCARGAVLARERGKPDPNLPCTNNRVVVLEATIDGVPQPSWIDAS